MVLLLMEHAMPVGNICSRCFGSKQHTGFILVAMLLLLMGASYVLVEVSVKWSDAVKRDREYELLKVGDTIRKAIGSYYNQTNGVVKQYPPSLEALLLDDRFLSPKRYLRQLYIDPVTRREGWGLIMAPGGGIMGIHSLSAQSPYKRENFKPSNQSFENQKFYANWLFIYVQTALPKSE